MTRRVAAVSITVAAVMVAGAFRTSVDEPAHEHSGVGPLSAVVALVMMVVAGVMLFALLRQHRV